MPRQPREQKVPSRPSRAIVATLLVASVALFAVTAFGAGLLAGVTPPSVADLVWFAGFLAFPLVGALIAWHRPENRIGWLFLAVGVLQYGAAVVDGLAQHLVTTHPDRPTGAVLVLAQNVLFAVAWVLATTYPMLLYPDGRPLTRRWRWVGHATTGALAVLLLAVVLTPGRVIEDDRTVNPFGVPALAGIAPLTTTTMLFALLALTLAAMASFVIRWRRSAGEHRRQLAWLALAAVVFTLTTVASLATDAWTPDWFGAVVEAVGVAALPLATSVAILRADLFDIASALDRTIVYTALTVVVVGTYAAALAVASTMLAPDPSRGSALLATAVVAVSLSPVKDRLMRGVDRLLFGDRRRPYQVLTGLAARLSRIDAVEELLGTVTDTLTAKLRLPYTRVVLGADLPSGPEEQAFALVSHGRREGTLLVGRRTGQARFDPQEQQLLSHLADQIAVAVRGARLAEDLRESRERIVRAREEERLRVRRDLHDGLGPLLAAASLHLDVLADRTSDAETRRQAATIKDVISQSVADIRQIVHGLRPPALDDLGLYGVIREQAETLRAAGLDVRVDCPPELAVSSAAVEVAAYRIVTEAMTNVVRHARATTCTVAISESDGWLRVQVSDDGIGLPVAHRDGVGLASMRERADELGGSLEIERPPEGGTTLIATLPVPAAVLTEAPA